MTISRRHVIKATALGALSSIPIFNQALAQAASSDIQHGSRNKKTVEIGRAHV